MLSTLTYCLRHSRPGFIELPTAYRSRKADTAVSADGSPGKLKKIYPRCVALATTSRAVGECHASIPRVRFWGYAVPADCVHRQAGWRAAASTGVRNGAGTGAGTSAECCLGLRAIARSL